MKLEDGFWEALKALGEPTVGVDGFMVHIDGSHFIGIRVLNRTDLISIRFKPNRFDFYSVPTETI